MGVFSPFYALSCSSELAFHEGDLGGSKGLASQPCFNEVPQLSGQVEKFNKGSMCFLPTETWDWRADSEVKTWAPFFPSHPDDVVVFVLHGNGNGGRVARGLCRVPLVLPHTLLNNAHPCLRDLKPTGI